MGAAFNEKLAIIRLVFGLESSEALARVPSECSKHRPAGHLTSNSESSIAEWGSTTSHAFAATQEIGIRWSSTSQDLIHSVANFELHGFSR